MLETRWEKGWARLQQFVAREGHAAVLDYHVEDGFRLGAWVSELHSMRRHWHTLSEERIELLDALEDWHWSWFGVVSSKHNRHLCADLESRQAFLEMADADRAAHVYDGLSARGIIENDEVVRDLADHFSLLKQIGEYETFLAESDLVDTLMGAIDAAVELGYLDRYLLPALGGKQLDEIQMRDVERLKGKLLKKGLSPKTVNNALATLGKMLRHAQDLEIISHVPRIRLLRVPKPEFDFLTFEEADRLLEAAEARPEWHVMMFTALRTGMRFGELCELRWKDINLEAGKLVVRRSFYRGHITTPKSDRQREIPLSPATVDVLKRYRHLRSELVFCKPDGGRRINRRADTNLKRICKLAELRPVNWHMFRHTFASHLVMKGVALKAVQELLGHSTIEMTMRYAHLSPDVKQESVATLDEPVKKRTGSDEPVSIVTAT